MFVSNLHFEEILEWFRDSRFEYLLLFLPSCDTRDRELDDFIIHNQGSIDQLTGEKIAYIAYGEMELPNSMTSVKEHHLPSEAIRTHVYISDEVCEYFSFGRYKLPALILISKQLNYKLYPISTEKDLDSYFTPIGIVTSFLSDYNQVKWKKRQYEDEVLETDRAWRIQERSRLEEENTLLEESFQELERDVSIAERIKANYCRLFNHLKAKNVKQNVFEEVFARTLDENAIVKDLKGLGLDDILCIYAIEMVNDLKKVRNFRRFQAQYGCVATQITRLFNLCSQEIVRNKERINELTEKVLSIENKMLIAPEKRKEYEEELNSIVAIYGKKLNNVLFVSNGTDILLNVLNKYSSGLIEILTVVSEKSNKINVIIEHLNKRIEEEGFDVFISSKSEDYKKAIDVYNFLSDKGFKPFLADPVLREIGTDYYGYLIRRIVNKCRYMIVFSSNVEYMTTPYVSAEWNQFLDELSSGIKYGKLFSIISSSITAKMLPPGLSTRQFFTIDSYKESLLQYISVED